MYISNNFGNFHYILWYYFNYSIWFEISRRSVSQTVPNIACPQELAGRVYDSLEKLKVMKWHDIPWWVAKTPST